VCSGAPERSSCGDPLPERPGRSLGISAVMSSAAARRSGTAGVAPVASRSVATGGQAGGAEAGGADTGGAETGGAETGGLPAGTTG
jgi:hypothetical protein